MGALVVGVNPSFSPALPTPPFPQGLPPPPLLRGLHLFYGGSCMRATPFFGAPGGGKERGKLIDWGSASSSACLPPPGGAGERRRAANVVVTTLGLRSNRIGARGGLAIANVLRHAQPTLQRSKDPPPSQPSEHVTHARWKWREWWRRLRW